MNDSPPGKGLFGWLGRQVGHIKKAVQTDVTPEKVVYRHNRTEEREHPAQPGVKLRRTTIDEVVVPKQLPMKQGDDAREGQRDEGTKGQSGNASAPFVP